MELRLFQAIYENGSAEPFNSIFLKGKKHISSFLDAMIQF